MTRRFPIADLRTLVAKALQSASYVPADSGRVRAVPNTRTIRYYTTLGLIERPAEMRGRTAMYGEIHVLQLVAIKRLQAENQTLSDIQSRLVGSTTRKLRTLANLPAGFWEAADQYLTKRKAAKSEKAPSKPQKTPQAADFWAEPAALPEAEATVSGHERSTPRPLASCTRLALHPAVQLIVEGTLTASEAATSVDVSRLQAAAVPLLKELAKQGLLDHDSSDFDPMARPSHDANSSLSSGDSQ